jgi:hypothetical protein
MGDGRDKLHLMGEHPNNLKCIKLLIISGIFIAAKNEFHGFRYNIKTEAT